MINRTENSSGDEGLNASFERPENRAVEDLKTAFAGAQDAVVEAARGVGDQAVQAAQTAREKAERLADQGKIAGADHVESFARATRGAAEDLAEQSPQIAGFVSQAADGLEKAASAMRNRSIGDFVDMAGDFARRQPTAFFASTVLAGFVLSRFVKSGVGRTSGTPPESRTPRPDSPNTNTDVSQGMPAMSSSLGEQPS